MKKINTSYRLTPKLKKKIDTVARMEKRSHTNLVEKAMDEYCNKKLKQINPEIDGN